MNNKGTKCGPKGSESISNMVNVLTDNSVKSLFELKLLVSTNEEFVSHPTHNGVPPPLYDMASPFMEKLSKQAKTSVMGVSILGHIVKPGYDT